MRKTAFFLAAAAAALCTVACNKEIPAQGGINELSNADGGTTELRVGISGGTVTKSTSITSANEVKVNSLQVFVFRGDALDAYGSEDNSEEITLSCTAGEREVYAVVNAPSFASVTTKTALLATVSNLSDNSGTSFEMIGNKTVTLPQASTVTIDVKRIGSVI